MDASPSSSKPRRATKKARLGGSGASLPPQYEVTASATTPPQPPLVQTTLPGVPPPRPPPASSGQPPRSTSAGGHSDPPPPPSQPSPSSATPTQTTNSAIPGSSNFSIENLLELRSRDPDFPRISPNPEEGLWFDRAGSEKLVKKVSKILKDKFDGPYSSWSQCSPEKQDQYFAQFAVSDF